MAHSTAKIVLPTKLSFAIDQPEWQRSRYILLLGKNQIADDKRFSDFGYADDPCCLPLCRVGNS